MPGISAISGISGASPISGATPEIVIPSSSDREVVVEVPTDVRLKALIDILAKYIAEDGHPFEQQIMDKEAENEKFRFLFDMDSKEHLYYRWRVFASAQGDTPKSWRLEPFQVYLAGPMWKPPTAEFFEEPRVGLDKDRGKSWLSSRRREERGPQSGGLRLTDDERDDLEDTLRDLTMRRDSIRDAMVFCLDHSDSALEIADCMMEALTIFATPHDTKIARLYLLSDILHNSSCSRQSAWAFRSSFEKLLPDIFDHLAVVYKGITGRLTAEQLKDSLMAIIRVWDSWGVYGTRFTKGLQATLLSDEQLSEKMLETAVKPTADPDLTDTHLDGEILPNFDELVKYPFWLRENIEEWSSMEVCQLERTCQLHGLSSRIDDDDTESGIEQSRTEQDAKELLLDRLVGYETYWRRKKDEEDRQVGSFLSAEADPAVCGSGSQGVAGGNGGSSNGMSSPTTSVLPMSMAATNAAEMQLTMGDGAALTAAVLLASESQSNSRRGVKFRDADGDASSSSSGDLFNDEDGYDEADVLAGDKPDDEDIFENVGKGAATDQHEDEDSVEAKRRREKLRDIELEVMKFKVSLEEQKVASTNLIQLQCDAKRQQLLNGLQAMVKAEAVATRQKLAAATSGIIERKRNSATESSSGGAAGTSERKRNSAAPAETKTSSGTSERKRHVAPVAETKSSGRKSKRVQQESSKKKR